MQPKRSVTGKSTRVYERVLSGLEGDRDETLVFAASSIIREITSDHYTGFPVIREICTERGLYTLRGNLVNRQGTPQPVIIVRVAGNTEETASREEQWRAAFGLTRKEVRVAMMLADEKSNADIASELFISPHTARHHTQSVLDKLGVRSRRDVAAALKAR